MHFCLLRSVHAEPELTLDGDPINVVEETKFLGLIFYTKLSFIPHIKYLKTLCLKALDILRVLSNSDWGLSQLSNSEMFYSLCTKLWFSHDWITAA